MERVRESKENIKRMPQDSLSEHSSNLSRMRCNTNVRTHTHTHTHTRTHAHRQQDIKECINDQYVNIILDHQGTAGPLMAVCQQTDTFFLTIYNLKCLNSLNIQVISPSN